MSLTSLSMVHESRLTGKRVVILLWISCAVYGCGLALLQLLNRLGMPIEFSHLAGVLVFAIGVVVLSWLGRTMTSNHFFFAQKSIPASASGWSGGNDWASGAFLLTFLSAGTADKALWMFSIMLGLLLMAVMFAHSFRRSNVSTLAGFLAWRYPKVGAGFVAILASSVVLALLAVAEFEIARTILATIGTTSPVQIGGFILFLAVIPALLGGWMSMLFVNLVLTLWLAISLLVPTFLIGIVPQFLFTSGASFIETSPLTSVLLLDTIKFPNATILDVLMTLGVVSFGFSVLPHALSRLSLVARPVAAIEHLGWSGLFVFVLMSALGFSLILITNAPPENLRNLLVGHPVLYSLPYFALLFAAFNALSATLFALASGLVRGFQRSRNLNPGERSMFGTRLFIVLIACAIWWWLGPLSLPVAPLFLLAITFGAGSLFIPLSVAIWSARTPGIVATVSIIAGTLIGAFEIWHLLLGGPQSYFASPVHAAAASIAFALICTVLGYLFTRVRGKNQPDSRLDMLRGNQRD